MRETGIKNVGAKAFWGILHGGCRDKQKVQRSVALKTITRWFPVSLRGGCCVTQCFPDNVPRYRLFLTNSVTAVHKKPSMSDS